MKTKLALAFLGSFCGAPLLSGANIIDSIYGAGAGSFEIPTPAFTQYATYEQGSTAITGWTVGQANIDWVKDTVWTASDGHFSLDMNGTAPGVNDPPKVGSIQTMIPTTAGTTYRITFDVSGYLSYGNTTNPKELEVAVKAVNLSNVVTDISNTMVQFAATNTSTALPLVLNWETRTIDFVATEAQTSIAFISKTTNNTSGILLDNVAVVAIPEPGSAALLGGGLLLALRRRRR